MRGRLKIVYILFFSLSNYSLVAQEFEKNNIISFSIGPSVIVEGVSVSPEFEKNVITPSVNVSYNRLIFKNIGIGVGYDFIKSSGVAIDGMLIYSKREYAFKNNNHLFNISLAYHINTTHFRIVPKLSLVCDYNVFTCPEFDDKYSIAPKFIYILKPSIQCGYVIKNWMIDIQYYCLSYHREVLSEKYIINALTFPYNYRFWGVNLGVGYMF